MCDVSPQLPRDGLLFPDERVLDSDQHDEVRALDLPLEIEPPVHVGERRGRVHAGRAQQLAEALGLVLHAP